MAYSEDLAQRLRLALQDVPDVEEKKMFGGLAFMVRGKMCLTVGPARIMCRISPHIAPEALRRSGTRIVVMGGRKYKGFLHIDEEVLGTGAELQYWIDLALNYNRELTT